MDRGGLSAVLPWPLARKVRAPAERPGRMARWIVLGNVLVAAVLVAATLLNVQGDRETELDHVREAADNLAHSLSVELASQFQLVDNALATIALRYAVADTAGRERQLRQALGEQTLLLPFVGGLRASDANGLVAFGLPPGEAPFSVRERGYFAQARQGHASVVSEPVFSHALQDWCLIVARPLENGSGEFQGIVYAVLPARHFRQLFSKLAIGAEGAIALRSDTLRLVARHAEAAPGTARGLDGGDVTRGLRQALAHDADRGWYVAPTTLDGVERVTAYRRVPGHRLIVLAGLSPERYLAHWVAAERRQWFFAGLILLLVACGFAYVFAQHRRQLEASAQATRLAKEQALVLDNDLVGMLRVESRRIV